MKHPNRKRVAIPGGHAPTSAVRRTWKLEDAKARLSEVVRLALSEGPQRVTRRGRDAVIISAEQQPEPESWVDELRGSSDGVPDLASIIGPRDRRERRGGFFEPPAPKFKRR